MVSHNRFAHDLNAKLVQLFGQEERVGVHAVRSQQFRTNRDDFRFHLFNYPTKGKPRTSQSKVKSSPVTAFSTCVLVAKIDRKSTRLNSSHRCISYAVFCLK